MEESLREVNANQQIMNIPLPLLNLKPICGLMKLM